MLKNLYLKYSIKFFFNKNIADKNKKGNKKKIIFFCIIAEKMNKNVIEKYKRPLLF